MHKMESYPRAQAEVRETSVLVGDIVICSAVVYSLVVCSIAQEIRECGCCSIAFQVFPLM